MKRVLLMRHAKSSWENYSLTDHERGLNERGRKDAPRIAEKIKEKGILPEAIYSSDAKRTQETFAGINDVLQIKNTFFIHNLYMASANEILNTIRNADNTYKTIIILAHNPGITNAFSYLADVSIDNVPTCGVGCLNFEVNSFDEIAPKTGELEYFVYPKML